MRMRCLASALLIVSVGACSGNKSEPPASTGDVPKASAETARVAPAPTPTLPADAYGFSARPSGVIPTLVAGSVTDVRFVFRNESQRIWPGSSLEKTDKPLNAAYHVLDQKGQLVTFEGLRAVISADVPPGGEVVVALHVQAPNTPGRYQLQPDLLQETVSWFGTSPPPKKNPPVPFQVVAPR
jgi:hypothetical protein